MNRLSIALVSAAAFSGLLIASVCWADDTTRQLQEQQLGIADPDKPSDDELAAGQPGKFNEILLKYDHLNRHFELMDMPDAEDQLQQSLRALQGNARTFDDLTALYKVLTDWSGKDNQFYGEARWRVLYLLGELQDPRAADMMFEIATSPMPNPELVGEVNYKVEYRLRARAISGLEKLKEIELLQKIYGASDLFSGVAAASLYELDRPPEGVTKVDGVKVLGLGDPKDYNPAKGSPGEITPSGHDQAPTDDRLSVTPKWPADK